MGCTKPFIHHHQPSNHLHPDNHSLIYLKMSNSISSCDPLSDFLWSTLTHFYQLWPHLSHKRSNHVCLTLFCLWDGWRIRGLVEVCWAGWRFVRLVEDLLGWVEVCWAGWRFFGDGWKRDEIGVEVVNGLESIADWFLCFKNYLLIWMSQIR